MFKDRVNERHALVASGTRRGGRYKADSDEDEELARAGPRNGSFEETAQGKVR